MIDKGNQTWIRYSSGAVLFILLLGLCTGKMTFAQGNGVQVRIVGPELIKTEPQKVVTIVFRVTNTTDQTREFIGEVDLPDESWLITREFPFELGPSESDIRLVSFVVPLKVLAGNYQITYTVRDQEMPSISDECRVDIVVLSLARLEVRFMEAPQYVIAGKSYQSCFAVINRSNAASAIVLEIESERDYPAAADISQFHLEPGESQNIILTVETSPDIRQRVKHRLKLTATALDFKDGVATATSRVEIIPRITGIEDPFHRLPGKATLRTILEGNEENTFGFQMEISGSGTLDEEGTKELTFFSKGPALRQKLFSELRDEQRLSYRTKRGEIYLGDRSYSLSPLTERYRYGRGVEGRLNLGPLTLRVYSQESRPWIRPGLEENAYRVSYQLGQNYEVALNYLEKKEINPPADFSGELADHYIWSLQARLQPADNVNLDLEYAQGYKIGEVSESDDAYRLKVRGHYRGIYYRGEVIQADPHYPGFYSDLDLKSGNVAFPLGKNLGLNVYYCDRRENLELDPTLPSALHEGYFYLSLDYKLTPITRLSLICREHNREDRLSPSSFNYEEESLGVRIEQNFKKLSFHGLAELGKSYDNLTSQLHDLEKYRASLIYRPTRGQYYSGYYQIEDTYDFLDSHQYRVTAGLNARLQVSDRTSLQANFHTSEDWETFGRDIMEIILKHQLFNGESFSLRVRHTSYRHSDYNDKTTYFLEYTIPFQMPVSHKTGTGILKGRVYDVENKERGIADVIVRTDGATAVTDEDGNFIFPSLKPDSYYLWVDKASIGLNRVTVQKTPMEVSVEGGKETLLNLGVVRSACVSGRVVVHRYEDALGIAAPTENESKEQRKLVESYGLANTFVELTNGLDVQRRVTDNKGRFCFEDLCPGRWTLRVYDTNVPEFHYLEKETFEFELKAGDKKEIEVRVLPRLRPIHIIEKGGEVIIEEKEEE